MRFFFLNSSAQSRIWLLTSLNIGKAKEEKQTNEAKKKQTERDSGGKHPEKKSDHKGRTNPEHGKQ